MKGTKTNRDRKSPGAAEFFKKQRQEQNRKRPKQVYNKETKQWER